MKQLMRTIRGKASSLRTRLLVAGGWLMLTVTIVTAQSVPALVNYQGRLANPDGSPLPTAEYELSFRVWDAATNGVLKWGPQIFDGTNNGMPGHGSRIPVVQGYFNVMLGPVDTNGVSLADAFTASNRYVEVTVSNRLPILPRQQILTTPFAFQAANSANSAKLAGYDWSVVFGTNDPVAGTILPNKLTDGSITLPKLAARTNAQSAPLGGIAVSGSVTFTTNAYNVGLVDIPGLSAVLVTSGRPVLISLVPGSPPQSFSNPLIPDPDGSQIGALNIPSYASYQPWAVAIFRNETNLVSIDRLGTSTAGIPNGYISEVNFPASSIKALDLNAPRGTNTYSIKVSNGDFRIIIVIRNVRLVAYEL